MLTDEQLQTFRRTGHVTVPGMFSRSDIDAAIRDIDEWSRVVLSKLNDENVPGFWNGPPAIGWQAL